MKMLLAIDDSDSSAKAVRFVGETLAGRAANDSTITLLHVVESIPEFLISRGSGTDADAAYRKVIEDWDTTHQSEGEALLENRLQTLLDAGIPKSAVETKIVVKKSRPESKKVVAALAIIDEMKNGNYSVVCLGRRGTTAVEASFIGSVAEKVLREANGRSIWVID